MCTSFALRDSLGSSVSSFHSPLFVLISGSNFAFSQKAFKRAEKYPYIQWFHKTGKLSAEKGATVSKNNKK
jgi:fucose 4-O-acetylase-like acetyltransferase